MTRLATAAVLVPLALLAVFKLPTLAFFLLVAALLEGAAIEYAALARHGAPQAPWWLLYLLAPAASAGLAWSLAEDGARVDAFWLLGAATGLVVVVGTTVLFARTPVTEAPFAMGALVFGTIYFAAPTAALVWLQHRDPWVLFLLLAIVWLGDTAAYVTGISIGRHALAPVVSPKKTWEGAIAGFAISLLAAAIWCLWRLPEFDFRYMAVAVATALAGQTGDLVKSLFKRAVGVKDSGHLLPGHGGLFDRMDAMLFAAPVMVLMLHAFGLEAGR